MLKRKYSIDRSKFDLIYKKGKNINSTNLYIKYLPNHASYSQFAIVVSKKVEKLATKRNRLRRIIKSEISDNLKDITSGYYYIISIKKNITEQAMKKELAQILNFNK